MQLSRPILTIVLLSFLLLPACLKKQDGTVEGTVIPRGQSARIMAVQDNKEVLTVPAGMRDGKFTTGSYIVRANAPGHAGDAVPIVITGKQTVELNTVLLPITSIDGVDWTAGKIRATGTGMPPQDAASETVRREMAKRAALTDARRNMLRIIEQMRINDNQDMKSAMRDKNVASKVEGCLKGATLINERELDGGAVEVVLELPLSGPGGLYRCIAD